MVIKVSHWCDKYTHLSRVGILVTWTDETCCFRRKNELNLSVADFKRLDNHGWIELGCGFLFSLSHLWMHLKRSVGIMVRFGRQQQCRAYHCNGAFVTVFFLQILFHFIWFYDMTSRHGLVATRSVPFCFPQNSLELKRFSNAIYLSSCSHTNNPLKIHLILSLRTFYFSVIVTAQLFFVVLLSAFSLSLFFTLTLRSLYLILHMCVHANWAGMSLSFVNLNLLTASLNSGRTYFAYTNTQNYFLIYKTDLHNVEYCNVHSTICRKVHSFG